MTCLLLMSTIYPEVLVSPESHPHAVNSLVNQLIVCLASQGTLNGHLCAGILDVNET